MHRMHHRHETIDDMRPWTPSVRSVERHFHGVDHDTRALLHRGLHSRMHATPPGGSPPPPTIRSRRPVVRDWRSARSASRPSLGSLKPRAARSEDTHATSRRPADHLPGIAGMTIGAAIGLALIRSAGPSALRSDWWVATVPLVTLWASVGGLVAISIARARRGEDPLPELVARGPLGERRSLARPVAIGAVIGVVLIAVLRAGIALAGWLPPLPR